MNPCVQDPARRTSYGVQGDTSSAVGDKEVILVITSSLSGGFGSFMCCIRDYPSWLTEIKRTITKSNGRLYGLL